jgi:CubicO group peptidase (beta-lactamase class C family)
VTARCCAGALLALAIGCRPAPTGDADRVLAGLRPKLVVRGRPEPRWTLAERMREHHVPGISIAVIVGGKIAWTRAFGTKSAGTVDSVTTETLFQAQSISKAVAASAMLRLVDAGKLSLDQDVNELLTSWKVPPSPFTLTEKVTLRRIVSHSAGFTVGGLPGYIEGDSLPTLVQTLNGAKPANNPPIVVDTVPGARWRYSGGGMTVMQQLMIDVTKEPFPELMKRLVLEPAGMTRSTYQQPLPEARRREAASGHDLDGAMIPGRWRIQPEMAAAGLWTTSTDLAKWALDIAAAWAGRPAALLSPAMAKEMLRVQKAPSGLGVFVSDTGSALRFEHDGANRGFRAAFVMFPALGLGAAVMTNGEQGSRLTDELFQSVGAEYGWPHSAPTVRSAATIDSTVLDGLAGDYLTPGPNYRPVVVTVRRDGVRLFLEVPGFVPKAELVPTTADSFFTLDGSDVTFRRNQAGRGDTVRLGGQTVATRAPNDSAGGRPNPRRAPAR